MILHERTLNNLANQELEDLIKFNGEFILRNQVSSGNFSEEEQHWYQEMIKEINQQLENQKIKRQEKLKEIQQYMTAKKKELSKLFKSEYEVAIEELAAKEGTGKRYGRPKRLAQERLRMEMSKCEEAQQSITQNIDEIKSLYNLFNKEKQNQEYYKKEEVALTQKLRKILMTLRTGIFRYAAHIDALITNFKCEEMPRVSYNEDKFDVVLSNQEELDEDKLTKEKELEALGHLFYQKDNKKFNDWVIEIEKQVKEECKKIYTGNAAKMLTGPDQIPDYLRKYLENMKQVTCENFRISMCRQLRFSCEEISNLSDKIAEMINGYLFNFFANIIETEQNQLTFEFAKDFELSERQKSANNHHLGPALANPKFRAELDQLCDQEKKRLNDTIQHIKEFKSNVLNLEFKHSNQYFKRVLNNFEFLLLYFDNCILFEDFNKLPGDEEYIKKHDNLKNLLKRKQQGFAIDTSSERSLTKIWHGVSINSFQVEDQKIEYNYQSDSITADDKGKKGKQQQQQKDKDAKKKQDQQQQDVEAMGVMQKPDETKLIKSIKTFRQKTAHHHFIVNFRKFKDRFDKNIANTTEHSQKMIIQEQKFEFFWSKTVKQLLDNNDNDGTKIDS